MAKKFGRKYRLTIESNDGQAAIVIEPPFTCHFSLNRSTMATLNTAEISIYNLGPATRQRIYRDRYNPFINQQRIVFEAGYEQLTTVFAGTIFEANSKRQGTNIITTISSRDGGFDVAGTTSYRTLKKGSTLDDVIRSLVADFKTNGGNVQLGTLSPTLKQQVLNRPVVLNGNTYELMQKYTDRNCYIDLEKVYVLRNNEVIESEIPLISSATGMLGTPRRDDAVLSVDTLFDPDIVMGQKIQLQSDVSPIYNGVYKTIGVQHVGTISEAECGNLISTFTLLSGSQVFGEFQTVSANNPGVKQFSTSSNTQTTNVAKTLYGEARGSGSNGMQAVANVIQNRANTQGFPNTLNDVVLQKSQFSVWNPQTGGAIDSGIVKDYNTMVGADMSDPSYATAYGIAQQADAGTLPDITNGATYYYSGSTPPYWAKNMTVTYQTGGLTFLKP